MMVWIFVGITLSAVLMATFVGQMRKAILALWVAGLGIGAMYLTVGAEFLAIIQWIVSTLVTISFVFFSVMFGEYNSPSTPREKNGLLLILLSLLLGGAFAVLIWLGASSLPGNGLLDQTMVVASSQSDLRVLGKVLTQDHLLSLEVLALILFLVLVGGGVISRTEGGDSQ